MSHKQLHTDRPHQTEGNQPTLRNNNSTKTLSTRAKKTILSSHALVDDCDDDCDDDDALK